MGREFLLNYRAPLRQPCPRWGRGRLRFRCISKKVQVIRHYRNRGAAAAGRSPGSVILAHLSIRPKSRNSSDDEMIRVEQKCYFRLIPAATSAAVPIAARSVAILTGVCVVPVAVGDETAGAVAVSATVETVSCGTAAEAVVATAGGAAEVATGWMQ